MGFLDNLLGNSGAQTAVPERWWDMPIDQFASQLGQKEPSPFETGLGLFRQFGENQNQLLSEAAKETGPLGGLLDAPPSMNLSPVGGEWDAMNPVSSLPTTTPPYMPQESPIFQAAQGRQVAAAPDVARQQAEQARQQATGESFLEGYNRKGGLLSSLGGSETPLVSALKQQAPPPQSVIDKILNRFGPIGQGISKFISPVTGAMGDLHSWGREQALAGNLSALAPEFSAGVLQAEDARLKREDAQSMRDYRTTMGRAATERNRLAGEPKPQETKRPRAFTPEEIAEMNPPEGAYMLETYVDDILVESIPKFPSAGDQTIFQPATQESLLDVRRRQMNETYVGTWKKEREAIEDNEHMISNLKTANYILSTEENPVETGKLTEILLPMRQWGESLGWVESGENKEIEFLNSLYKWIIPRMRVVGSGSTSDGEIKMFSEATAGLGNTTQGNRLIAQYGIQLHEYNKRRNQLRSRLLKTEAYDDDAFGDYADRVLGPSYEKIDGRHLDGRGTPEEIAIAKQQYESVPDGYMYYDKLIGFQIKGSED